jgi:ribonuclease J
MSLKLTVHRAAHEIGGNCIELRAPCGARLLLDVGRPLDALPDASGLLPATLDVHAPVAGVVISHPHQDHYGLLDEIPRDWPIYCGEASAAIMRLTQDLTGRELDRTFRFLKSAVSKSIGPFTVTRFLTDHSAFDASMILVECAGRRVLYSGDFRVHGRKASLVEQLLKSLPDRIDALLLEGTNLGSVKPCVTEDELEQQFAALFKETRGRVFVTWSAQNVDRTVTLYRAALKAKRSLAVDLYTASVLATLKDYGRIPQPGWPGLKVVVTSRFARLYRRRGNASFVEYMAKHGIAASALAKQPSKWVIMTRPSLLDDFQRNGVNPCKDDSWSWSMWRGYLDQSDGRRVRDWCSMGGATARHLHTSGHASPADLSEFAGRVDARTTIPIHGVAWDPVPHGFPHITRLADGQPHHL